jgi:hypothetical protein
LLLSSAALSKLYNATTDVSLITRPAGPSSCPKVPNCGCRAPTRPHKNGKVERIIRTINNVIRTLLIQASLPECYWVEGLYTVMYLLNHLPAKTISAVCPHVALFGSASSYEHLRVFGCACYPNIAATAPHKLAPWSTRCVFLDYSTDHKGYRCLDLSTDHLIISCHVVFDEESFPLAVSLNLTGLDFLCETGSPVSTIGTPVSLAGSSTAPACQPTPIVPFGFEPHAAPMPVPLLTPQVPLGFPPCAASVPSAPRITAAGGPTDCHGGQTTPYIEADGKTTPYREFGGPTAPSGGLTTWGPSATPAASPGVGPPPRAWPTSPIAYTSRPRQPVTPSPATPPRRSTTTVPMTPPMNPHPMVTRANDGFWLPRDQLTLVSIASSSLPSAIPTSVRAALADLNWRAAMEEEYGALMNNGT